MSDEEDQPLTLEQSRDDLLLFMRAYCADPMNCEIGALKAISDRLAFHLSLLEVQS